MDGCGGKITNIESHGTVVNDNGVRNGRVNYKR